MISVDKVASEEWLIQHKHAKVSLTEKMTLDWEEIQELKIDLENIINAHNEWGSDGIRESNESNNR